MGTAAAAFLHSELLRRRQLWEAALHVVPMHLVSVADSAHLICFFVMMSKICPRPEEVAGCGVQSGAALLTFPMLQPPGGQVPVHPARGLLSHVVSCTSLPSAQEWLHHFFTVFGRNVKTPGRELGNLQSYCKNGSYCSGINKQLLGPAGTLHFCVCIVFFEDCNLESQTLNTLRLYRMM